MWRLSRTRPDHAECSTTKCLPRGAVGFEAFRHANNGHLTYVRTSAVICGWMTVMTGERRPAGMVRLLEGEVVPESFTAVVVLPEKGLRWDVGVAMVDGRPHAQWVMTRSKPHAMSPELLQEVDLVAVLEAAVRHMARRQARGGEVAVAFSELDSGGEGGFARLARSGRRHPGSGPACPAPEKCDPRVVVPRPRGLREGWHPRCHGRACLFGTERPPADCAGTERTTSVNP